MQNQQEIQILEQMQALGSRRPSVRGSRGRAPSAQAAGPVAPAGHLLDGSGNILAVTVGVDQLTNA